MKRAILFILMSAAAGGVWAASPLDGTTWNLRFGGIRKVLFWKSDTLFFKDGGFITTSAQSRGFTAAPYVVINMAEGRWIATITRVQGDQMVWEGKVSGSKMSGEYTLVKQSGDRVTVPWSAKLDSYSAPSAPPAEAAPAAASSAPPTVQPVVPKAPEPPAPAPSPAPVQPAPQPK
ncbi:MAG: hypothetical protein HY078_12345 [Elusimicrobia bacterium]|nr:hypothetical protein [Elusimicrobiota bacterium]